MVTSQNEEAENQECKQAEREDSSPLLNQLSIVTDNLETYPARDALIALFHYIALICADFCSYFSIGAERNLSDNFVNMFGLLDDCGCIREYYRFHKAQQIKKTVNSYVRWVTLSNLIFNILYNPFEHIGWLGELKIIKASDQLWYFWTNVWWALGLWTSVMLNTRLVYLYYKQQKDKSKREDDPNFDSSEIISYTEMKAFALIAFRDFCDWSIAVHFMPEGFLWSSKLYHFQVGLIGCMSSWCRVHTFVLNKQ